MPTNTSNRLVISTVLLLLVVSISRLIPHPPNFTPIGALALFGGAYFGRKWLAFVLPIAVLFFSDLILNNFFLRSYFPGEHLVVFSTYMIPVYIAMLGVVSLGIYALRKKSVSTITLSALGASVIFYLVTNFGTWATGTMYTKDLAGLLSSYTAGLPFFKYTLMGNLFYCAVLFGGFIWIRQRYWHSDLSNAPTSSL